VVGVGGAGVAEGPGKVDHGGVGVGVVAGMWMVGVVKYDRSDPTLFLQSQVNCDSCPLFHKRIAKVLIVKRTASIVVVLLDCW
jgi:hypothetical protein